MIEYEPYHVHTSYSNCLTQPDSTMSIDDYAKVFRERGHHVLCISEHGNRSNVYEQFELAQKYTDDTFKMTPLAAAEAYFVPDRSLDLEEKDGRNFHLILIAKNMTGFKQMNKILSEANISGYYRHARIDYELLSQLDYKHFLCTTACVGGIMKDEKAEEYACKLHDIFRENFYLEIQHHPQSVQVETNKKILALYKKHKFPLIYGTDSHYIKHEDAIMRKEFLLSSGIKNGYEDEFDLFLPTAQEAYDMLLAQGVFSRAQIEEAMENTLQLRDFEGVSFTKERKFPISKANQSKTLEERNLMYQKMVCDGYIAKAGMPSEKEAAELRDEMNTIIETNSADYFIGLHDMIEEGIRLGGKLTTTSRGSACGFATNYALGFTSINRMKSPVPMYPERFISKAKLESGSMPDIDSNITNVEAFEEAGRRVFGEHSCYPMVAYGKNKTLSAFKMLARARNLDFEISNEVSKQIAIYENDRKHAIENNQDDPDYDVDSDVHIENYIDEQYLDLIRDSKQYQNIIVSISPHPCAHLIYHTDLREEIGVIRLKAKTGSKEPQMCLMIDGATADAYGYVKSDLLRVNVVKIISETFESVGKPVMTADELVEAVKDDPEVWNLYANGFTMGLNQCEREKTTERVMRFKPKNVVELSAFIAAIRPGAKSLVDGFVARQFHNYNIPAMDELLKLNGATGTTGQSSFLFYDEQVMTLAKAAGISPADANALIKHIKKKHLPEVASYKERFIPGFIQYLQEEQGTEESFAKKTAEDVWTVILNSASYLFNASHAYAMCLDSLYGAYLKVHYPYEFYTVLLKLYTEKGDKEKIAKIIDEMKKYKGIQLRAGRFGQDSRDWVIDKTNHAISQALSSMKFVSKSAAEDLYRIGQNTYSTFVDVLYALQHNTKINSRVIKVLISVGYFSDFGGNGKLTKIFDEYFEGKNKITKSLSEKTVEKRMKINQEFETNLEDTLLPIEERVRCENDYVGLCLSSDRTAPSGLFFISDVDSKYGVKATLYSVQRGTSGKVRIKKAMFEENPFKVGDCIYIQQGGNRPRFISNGQSRKVSSNEQDYWITKYHIAPTA